ncbi:MAG: LytR C-terminal domain-containing protein [Fibrobacter sp.]|nr:LytR C-terminal domain-containing protein [Fibrobacter sp.]
MYLHFSKARSFVSTAATVASLLFVATAFLGCEEEQKKAPVEKVVRHYKGDIEVLNSCGMQGAAAKMRAYLRENGFDVVSYRNDRLQNYDETILVLRNPEWEGAKALAKALKTENVMTVFSKRAVVDASVYIGKDFEQIIKPDQGETDDNE